MDTVGVTIPNAPFDKLRKVVPKFSESTAFETIVPHKRDVLARYGPIFSREHIPQLTEDEFRSFLLIENNHHWDGINRTGSTVCKDMPLLRNCLLTLSDETRPLAQRYDDALAPKIGIGKAIATAILLVSNPESYGVWNEVSEKALKAYGLFPAFERGMTNGQKYELVNTVLCEARDALGFDDLWTLDSFWFYLLDEANGTEQLKSKTTAKLFDEDFSQQGTSWWWVNQGTTYKVASAGGYIWAPKFGKDNRVFPHHANLTRVKLGDRILHYANGQILAIGEAVKESISSNRPADFPSQSWTDEGYLVQVRYTELEQPIDLSKIPLEMRISERSAFNRTGGVNQGYLYPMSAEFVGKLAQRVADHWPAEIPAPPSSATTWIFQCNPKKYNIQARLLEVEEGDEEQWVVTRYEDEMKVGDRVIIWQSGTSAAMLALGELTSIPFEANVTDYSTALPTPGKPGIAVTFRYSRILDTPILKRQLQSDPKLAHMLIVTAPMGTNFKVSPEEWDAISNLIQESQPENDDYVEPPLETIRAAITEEGLRINERTIRRYHLALKSRSFVILCGLSGTGKSWLSVAYARAVHAQYLVVSVAPNWTTNEDLLGFLNPLHAGKYHDTEFSAFLRRASAEYERATEKGRRPRPYHLVLDEMNLAKVEYYFAKFLSQMEVKAREGQAEIELAPGDSVLLSPNLFFIGTVNVDETTHGFSDKVYDRAQVIELEITRDLVSQHIGQHRYTELLLQIWDVMQDTVPITFRVLDDISNYIKLASELGTEWTDALDEQVVQKVLPKIKGHESVVETQLKDLLLIVENRLPLTSRKITSMLQAKKDHGFTSYFS